jgi:hypothetical protein
LRQRTHSRVVILWEMEGLKASWDV